MISYIETFIRNRRRELHISQQQLADALGVARSVLRRWETGEKPISDDRAPRLADLLQIGEEMLREMLHSSTPRVTSIRLPAELAPLAPVECTMEQMCDRIPSARGLTLEVKDKIGGTAFAELDTMFLRQTPWELYGGLVVLLDTAVISWAAPLAEGCRKPLFGENGLYEGQLLRLAIVWERDNVRDVLFPQVPVRVVGERGEESFRVDYLIVHAAPRRPVQTIGLEFDGGPHAFQKARDAERSAKLPFPVIRFDNAVVSSPVFLPRLLDQIREKSLWGQASNESYQNFLDERRERFERLKAAG